MMILWPNLQVFDGQVVDVGIFCEEWNKLHNCHVLSPVDKCGACFHIQLEYCKWQAIQHPPNGRLADDTDTVEARVYLQRVVPCVWLSFSKDEAIG